MLRRSLACLIVLMFIIPVGLAARFAPLGLGWFWAKYLGSVLWAVALYWFVAMLLPRLRPVSLFLVSLAAALVVEFSRLTPERHIDAFRLTLAGKILLGRFFSWKNIVAYVLALALAAAADLRFEPGRGLSR